MWNLIMKVKILTNVPDYILLTSPLTKSRIATLLFFGFSSYYKNNSLVFCWIIQNLMSMSKYKSCKIILYNSLLFHKMVSQAIYTKCRGD